METNNRPIAVQMQSVTKCYRLGEIGTGTLQGDLQSWWARLRGREDPNAPLRSKQQDAEILHALDGVDLTVYQGETLGIIGANGAGKSTLLKLLSRITVPTSGDIDLYGRVSSVLEVGAGFSGQLTGRENIYMNGAILGMSRAEIDERLSDIIAFSEVEQFIDTPVKRYSSGMFVKLAFAVAAHITSEILIMDEVLAVADAAFQKKCLARLRACAQEEGRTVLYVSHNMSTIRALCSRCIVLEKGKILFDGDTDEAVRLYLERALGSDPVNVELSRMPRSARSTVAVRMEQLVLEEKQSAVYSTGDPLRLRLRVHLAEPVKNLRLRLTLRTETDQAVGTAWSAPLTLQEGEHTILFTLPMDVVVQGRFFASVGLYCPGEGRRLRQLDHVTRAFAFEIVPTEIAQPWSNDAFGPVQLPEIQGVLL